MATGSALHLRKMEFRWGGEETVSHDLMADGEAAATSEVMRLGPRGGEERRVWEYLGCVHSRKSEAWEEGGAGRLPYTWPGPRAARDGGPGMLNVQGWGSHLERWCLKGVDKGDCEHGLGHSGREDRGQNNELFPSDSPGLWFDEQLAKNQSPDSGSAQVSTPAKY